MSFWTKWKNLNIKYWKQRFYIQILSLRSEWQKKTAPNISPTKLSNNLKKYNMDLVNNSTFVYALVGITMVANLITIPVNIKNIIKRILGGGALLLAVFTEYTLFSEGMKKMSAATGAAATQTTIQWSIILIIFTIVMVGFAIYGYYAVTGEYSEEE